MWKNNHDQPVPPELNLYQIDRYNETSEKGKIGYSLKVVKKEAEPNHNGHPSIYMLCQHEYPQSP